LEWRVDFHSHTWHSLDSWMPPASLVRQARLAGLDRIAVTDHGTIDGALEARAIDPELVVIGQEVRCEGETELIGLFLHERIPMGLPVTEVRARIHAQGGLVYAPHPFAYARHARRHGERAVAAADLIEVFNSRAFLSGWNRAAADAAAEAGKPGLAGTDAHFPWEIGRAYTSVPAFRTPEDRRAVVAAARPVGLRTAHPFIHVASVGLEYARRAGRPFQRPRRALQQRPAER
jgi:predicted metal-dependent phosphoesterase TrpH